MVIKFCLDTLHESSSCHLVIWVLFENLGYMFIDFYFSTGCGNVIAIKTKSFDMFTRHESSSAHISLDNLVQRFSNRGVRPAPHSFWRIFCIQNQTLGIWYLGSNGFLYFWILWVPPKWSNIVGRGYLMSTMYLSGFQDIVQYFVKITISIPGYQDILEISTFRMYEKMWWTNRITICFPLQSYSVVANFCYGGMGRVGYHKDFITHREGVSCLCQLAFTRLFCVALCVTLCVCGCVWEQMSVWNMRF